MAAGQPGTGEGGVGAVAAEVKVAFGQPVGELADHLGRVFHGGGRVVLAAQPDVDGHGDRAASPRWGDPQGDHDQVETQRIHHSPTAGAHGVTEDARSLDAPAALVKQRVVTVQWDHAVGGEAGDGVNGEQPPQRRHHPAPVAHEAVIGVVGAAPGGVGDRDDRGNRAPAGGEHPAGHQIAEDGEAAPVEHRRAAVQERRPGGQRVHWVGPLRIAAT